MKRAMIVKHLGELLLLLLLLLCFCEGSGGQENNNNNMGFPYVLENECTVYIQHLIHASPEQQEQTFTAISLPVSDTRMLPPPCRRPLLWLLCLLSFPSIDNSCIITQQDCEYVLEECEEEIPFNCSIFPSNGEERERGGGWGGGEGWGGLERGVDSEEGGCVTVFEASEIENAVVTCLNDDYDDIECCFEPYKQDRYSKECVFGCPFYPYGETRYNAVTYTGFSLSYVSLIACIFALFPVFVNKPKFPRGLFPAGILMFLFWNHIFYLSVYFNPEENLCGNEDDGFVAIEEFLDSTFCHVQVCLFAGTILGLGMLLVCAAFSFAFLCATITSAASYQKRYLRLFSIPCYILIGVFTIGGGLLQLLLIHIDVREYVGLAFAFGCAPALGIDSPIFTINVAFFGIIIICQLSGYFFIGRKSWHLFHAIANLNIFLLIMDYSIICAILNNTLFAKRDFETIDDRIIDYSTCVALHPREEDSGCEFETGEYYAWAIWFTISFGLLPLVTCAALYSFRPLLKWWYIFLTERKIVKLTEVSSTLHSTGNSAASFEVRGGGGEKEEEERMTYLWESKKPED